MNAPGVKYTIGGVEIQFPCKAYPSQLAMMNSIVKGLTYGKHCLLESPTGSGKSLALLCSALAWQQSEYECDFQHALKRVAAECGTVGTRVSTSKCEAIVLCWNVVEVSLRVEKKLKQCEEYIDEQKTSKVKKICQCICHSQTTLGSTRTNPNIVDLTLLGEKAVAQPENFLTPAVALPSSFKPTKSRCLAFCSYEKLSTSCSDKEKGSDFQPELRRIRNPVTLQKGWKKPFREHQDISVDSDSEELRQVPQKQSWTMEPSNQAQAVATDLMSFGSCSRMSCSMCCCYLVKSKDAEEAPAQDKRDKKCIPKIFFGTRTHKQISQITNELKRTHYSSVPMTILSSRDHSCVHPDLIPLSNRNEQCKELLDAKNGVSCRYYHGVHKIRNQNTLQQDHGLHQAWDIEDLVQLGGYLQACSYYAARELMQDALIVFCPYNYLLDPLIRKSMEINLKGQILILDEGHNIEDCARESSSFTLNQTTLLTARDELNSMVTQNIRSCHHQPLWMFCCSLLNWIQESCSVLSEWDYETSCKVWLGSEILCIFHKLGITADTFRMLQKHLSAVLEKEAPIEASNYGKEDSRKIPTISSATQSVLQSLFLVLDFIYRDNCRFAEDYRVALQQTYAWTTQPDALDAQSFFARPQYRRRQNTRTKTLVHTLSFWCLNPAVAFADLIDSARSIILTSGTLSPMASFSSELGVKFSFQLEANHVINKSQVWVGTVGTGPQGQTLCATFQHADTYLFQDEAGALILHVCKAVSKGVLCFLPSYKMLEKLQDRWKNIGIWEKLMEKKTVITEPRKGQGEFDQLLQSYYEAVRVKDGALLMAVFRGKVSEGLDFTDDNARAVVTIGIPFPNIKNLQVELKMKYNDQHCKARGLLSGSRWYEIQAYRALNQALGRCIRHKKDWGALILVDDRFGKNPNKFITGLSKWVRQLVKHHDSFPTAMQSLCQFSQCQTGAMEISKSSYSATLSTEKVYDLPNQETSTMPLIDQTCTKEPRVCQEIPSFELFTPSTEDPLHRCAETDQKPQKNCSIRTSTSKTMKQPHISSEASRSFKTPIFQTHEEIKDSHRFGQLNMHNIKENQENAHLSLKAYREGLNGLTVEKTSQVFELSQVQPPFSCEMKEPDEDKNQVDQSIFFTPELFIDFNTVNGDEEDNSPKVSPQVATFGSKSLDDIHETGLLPVDPGLDSVQTTNKRLSTCLDQNICFTNKNCKHEENDMLLEIQGRRLSSIKPSIKLHKKEPKGNYSNQPTTSEKIQRRKINRLHRLSRSRQNEPSDEHE